MLESGRCRRRTRRVSDRRGACSAAALDPGVARRVRSEARRRARASDRSPPDERRVRLCHPRPDGRRHPGRHRRLERRGRRRGLRQLRRRAVRAGRDGRALSRSRTTGRRPRDHRRRPARLLHRCRQDRPRAVGAQRIQQLYAPRGFRVVSGEGGRPFGFDRYSKALLRGLALPASRRAGRAAVDAARTRGRRRHHRAVRRAHLGRREPDRPRVIPTGSRSSAGRRSHAPDADATASIRKARGRSATRSVKQLSRGRAGCSRAATSPPAAPATRARWSSTTRRLAVEPRHSYTYPLNRRAADRQGACPAPGRGRSTSRSTRLHGTPGATPVVIWRNPRVVRSRRPPPIAGQTPAAAQLRARRRRRSSSTHAAALGAGGGRRRRARVRHELPTARPSAPTTSPSRRPRRSSIDVPADGNVGRTAGRRRARRRPKAVVRV